MDPWHAVLLTLVVLQLFANAFAAAMAFYREMQIKRLSECYNEHQNAHNVALNEIIKEVTTILTGVTQTMTAAMRAVDGSNEVAKDTQSNLLSAFNQFETRLTSWLNRLERMQINNNFTGSNIQGDVGQAAGKIEQGDVKRRET